MKQIQQFAYCLFVSFANCFIAFQLLISSTLHPSNTNNKISISMFKLLYFLYLSLYFPNLIFLKLFPRCDRFQEVLFIIGLLFTLALSFESQIWGCSIVKFYNCSPPFFSSCDIVNLVKFLCFVWFGYIHDLFKQRYKKKWMKENALDELNQSKKIVNVKTKRKKDKKLNDKHIRRSTKAD